MCSIINGRKLLSLSQVDLKKIGVPWGLFVCMFLTFRCVAFVRCQVLQLTSFRCWISSNWTLVHQVTCLCCFVLSFCLPHVLTSVLGLNFETLARSRSFVKANPYPWPFNGCACCVCVGVEWWTEICDQRTQRYWWSTCRTIFVRPAAMLTKWGTRLFCHGLSFDVAVTIYILCVRLLSRFRVFWAQCDDRDFMYKCSSDIV